MVKLETAEERLQEIESKKLINIIPTVKSELCSRCGHNGHITWCSQCNDGRRFETPKGTYRKREMKIEMGIGAPK